LQGRDAFFRMTPDEANTLCVFAVSRGKIDKRIDPHFYLPLFRKITENIQSNEFVQLGKIATFSNDTTDFSEFEEGSFEYLEIANVVLGCNNYTTTTTLVTEAPSRAKKKTQYGDICISTTRPQRGAIVEIKQDKIIASTGFSIIRKVDNFIDKQWLLYTLLSKPLLLQMLQRSSGGNYPAITEDELKKVRLPLLSITKQRQMCVLLENALQERKQKLKQADEILSTAKAQFFDTFGINFPEYKPSLFSRMTLGAAREIGVYCNPHSDYLNSVFTRVKANKYYAGDLEDFAQVNPTTSRKDLSDDTIVSFVPMPAVTEKTNEVVYDQKRYAEVKTGFTIFQKGDLLWAKITPCMQNSKSFLADGMPTEIGFGSTEFHVLRSKSDKLYMPFLWVLLSDEHILEAAQGMFGGSAGQQRVPDTFLKKFPIILLPVETQKDLADNVFAALKQAKQLRCEAEQEWLTARAQFEKELLGE